MPKLFAVPQARRAPNAAIRRATGEVLRVGELGRPGGLQVGAVDDAAEREADQVAASVLRTVAGRSGEAAAAPATRIRRNAAGPEPIHRKMAFKSSDLRGETVVGRIRRAAGDHYTWDAIVTQLDRYNKATSPTEELNHLRVLETLAGEWIAKYGASKDKDDLRKVASLRRLLSATEAEMSTLDTVVEEDYMSKLAATRAQFHSDQARKRVHQEAVSGADGKKVPEMFLAGPGAAGSFAYLTDDAKTLDEDAVAGVRAAAPDAARLTDAEIAAIRIYTGGNFYLMNPALEGNDQWFKGNVQKLTQRTDAVGFAQQAVHKSMQTRLKPRDEKQPDGTKKRVTKFKLGKDQRREIKTEAMQHTRLAVSGLRKLPAVTATTFRGTQLTDAEFTRDYQVGKTVTLKPFTSTARDASVPLGFLNKAGSEGKRRVLLEMSVTDGRDIAKLSVFGGEAEVLLIPGSKFIVTSITDETDKHGKPLTRVKAKQVA